MLLPDDSRDLFTGKLGEAHLGALSKGREVTSPADVRFEVYLSLRHMLGFFLVLLL